MSRRCHHGSPRHLRQAARERRRGPALAERAPIESVDRPNGAPADDLAAPSDDVLEPVDQLRPDEEPRDGPEVPDGVPAEAATEAAVVAAPAPADVPAPAAVAPAAMLDLAPTPRLASRAELPGRPEPPSEALRGAVPAPQPPVPAPVRPRPPGPPATGSPTAAAAPPMRPPHPREAGSEAAAGSGEAGLDRGATAPQLRRFIKSRAYVPMHELRRRFAINGGDDDVIPIDVDRQRVYVGLPAREGSLLGELLRAGDIGYELSLDPIAPIVVGVYPMRPVPRS